MSKYIKREDAIKRILQQCDNDCLYCMFNWQNDSGDYCAVEDCFADIPSADVVEVVRCKDYEQKNKRMQKELERLYKTYEPSMWKAATEMCKGARNKSDD